MSGHDDYMPTTIGRSLLREVNDLRADRDAALAEVARLREALDEAVRLLQAHMKPYGSRWADAPIPESRAFLAALAEGSDVLPTQRGTTSA